MRGLRVAFQHGEGHCSSQDFHTENRIAELDFASELSKIDAALQSAGVDTTKPMLAPVKWADAD
jgi:hypothetical protein